MKLPNKPRVLAATYNPVSNTKMISFLVDFPTVLLAELRTHRIISDLDNEPLYAYNAKVLNDFNLSANSARAIPANKYLQKILDNPFIPIWTGKQAGMSGSVVTEQQKEEATYLWLEHLQSDIVDTGTAQYVEDLIELGIHKQNANRLLSPYAYTTCILSGTEWDNFWSLRIAPEAQPEFKEIAIMLKELYDNADWKESKYHIPFYDDIVKTYYKELDKIGNSNEEYVNNVMKVSASMCAKLSYNTQDNEDTLEKHLERANMLIEHKHQEPFSHQAIAMDKDEYKDFTKSFIVKNLSSGVLHKEEDLEQCKIEDLGYSCKVTQYGWCYNLKGFISQRYILENW
jgi:hypothetical protein